ncbi:MAG: putative ABC transporter ATP-binding protein [Saprospiraceae bacterium]|nr:putative ABC transporter ATP-binding protein [Saprospiraceae bacterium]
MSGYQVLKRLAVFVRPYRGLFWTSALLAVAMAPLNAWMPYLANVMVDEHILKRDLPGLQRLALYYLGALVVLSAFRYAFTLMTNSLGQNIILDLRRRIYDHLLGLRLSYFDRTPVGTNTTRVINDLETVNSVFSEGLITILADALALFTVLGLMLYTSVKLTLICLVSFPLLLIASYVFKEKVKASFQRVRNEVARMNAFLQEHLTGMKTVQIFAAENRVLSKFRKINREYTQANIDGIFYYAVFFPVVEIISAASLGFMVWWGAQGVIGGEVTIGQLVAFPMYLTRLFQPVRTLADKFNTLQMGLLAASRVFALMDVDESHEDQGTREGPHLKGDLEFRSVSFSYDGTRNALQDISFILPQGKMLAVVGTTGSGKTSLINLINRLYEMSDGNIFLAGRDIREYPLSQLRSRIAVVLQDLFLFQGTVLENMTLKNADLPFEKVLEASKAIGAHPYIMQLPGDYGYVLSERGANLSVGQRQLISFVRALLTDPDLLILDEATSALDSETESILQAALGKLVEHRSSIVIAHRLSTIQQADLVLALEKGRIVEFGPPDELLRLPQGFYKRLFEKYFQTPAALS